MASAERVIVVAGSSPDLKITSWPLRDAPLVSRSIMAVAVVLSVAAGYFTSSIWVAIVCLLLLMGALWRIWAPVEFRLYELGVTQRAFQRNWRLPWKLVVGYRICNHGVLLLLDEDESLLAQLKGLYVPWQDSKDELLAALDHYLGQEPPATGSETTQYGPTGE